MPGPPSLSPGREVLERLYVREGLPTTEIARRFGVGQPSVTRWMQTAGIPTRKRERHVDEATLRSLYLDERKSTGEIATILGWPFRETVNDKLRLYGIPIRSASEAASLRRHAPAAREKMSSARKGKTSGAKGSTWSIERHQQHKDLWDDPEFRAKVIPKRSGANSPLWKGGVTDPLDLRLAQTAWLKRRAECYVRDNGICQDCGVKCLSRAEIEKRGHPERRIQAHHIIARRSGGGDELENLVTLCVSCHHKRERRYADALFA